MAHIYAVGDIHGHFDLLSALLTKIDADGDDLFVFLGDYIDRGDKSYEVVELLLSFAKTHQCVFLKGNHEDMMLNVLRNSANSFLWYYNGGEKTVKSYKGKGNILRIHGDFFYQLKKYYETIDYFFVHAGIAPGKQLACQEEHDLFWIRERFIESSTNSSKKIIFGHTVFHDPFIMKDKIGIDTGAGFGGPLTAIKLPEEEFISVNAF